MTRRAGLAGAVILVFVLVLLFAPPCGDEWRDRPEPATAPAPETRVVPPPVEPDETAAPEEEAPDALVRRSGRLRHATGGPAKAYDVFVTGPGVVRRLEAAKQAGAEVVAGEFRSVRLEDGVLPPAHRAGRTDGEGRFVASWGAGHAGRIDLLFVRKDARGRPRIVHRIAGADSAVPDEIRIPAAGAISGRVRDAAGDPVDKALVYCVPLDVLVKQETSFFSRRATPFTGLFLLDWTRHAQTAEDGRFRIAGLRPAPYRVFARRGDWGGTIGRVEVVSGPPNADHAIVLDTAGAYVHGRVVDERTNEPLSGCLVLADDPQGTTCSEEDGTYRIGPLVPGEFRGLVLKADYDPSPLGPFDLVAGRTYEAPTTYLAPRTE